ncbi:hypothetical protein CR203_14340 [Salipaludibacillus neizhouensis]|uniref:Uncharacterized protein n=1 Tax=Salipaludibacillus neizhouensis TaxID=885475 RepID=A0A3A9K173_9BACI|nr:hypothetical protein CR203_14340 [Salipaludibacillus neizhouensis]
MRFYLLMTYYKKRGVPYWLEPLFIFAWTLVPAPGELILRHWGGGWLFYPIYLIGFKNFNVT